MTGVSWLAFVLFAVGALIIATGRPRIASVRIVATFLAPLALVWLVVVDLMAWSARWWLVVVILVAIVILLYDLAQWKTIQRWRGLGPTGVASLAASGLVATSVVGSALLMNLTGAPPPSPYALNADTKDFFDALVTSIQQADDPTDPTTFPTPSAAVLDALRQHIQDTSIFEFAGYPTAEAEDHGRWMAKTLKLPGPDSLPTQLRDGPRAVIHPVEEVHKHHLKTLRGIPQWMARVFVDTAFRHPDTGQPGYDDPSRPPGGLRLPPDTSYVLTLFVPKAQSNPCGKGGVSQDECPYKGALWAMVVPRTGTDVSYASLYYYAIRGGKAARARALWSESSPDCGCYSCDLHGWCEACQQRPT